MPSKKEVEVIYIYIQLHPIIRFCVYNISRGSFLFQINTVISNSCLLNFSFSLYPNFSSSENTSAKNSKLESKDGDSGINICFHPACSALPSKTELRAYKYMMLLRMVLQISQSGTPVLYKSNDFVDKLGKRS